MVRDSAQVLRHGKSVEEAGGAALKGNFGRYVTSMVHEGTKGEGGRDPGKVEKGDFDLFAKVAPSQSNQPQPLL